MKRLALFALIAAFSVSVFATTVIPRSVEELASRSSNVVVGKAVKTWSAWNADHTLIFTYTQFAVERAIKGQSVQTITVKQLGGSADGITQKIAGVHNLRAGERAVLFLHPSEQLDGTLAVTALMQGHFRVSKSAAGEDVVSNGVSGASAFNTANGRISQFKGSAMRLSELEQRVRRAQ